MTFIWLLISACIGLVIAVGNVLPTGDLMTYTKRFDKRDLHKVAIFLQDTQRKFEVLLTNRLENAMAPNWSSDGQQIAYLSSDGEHVYLNVMKAFGQDKRRIPVEFTPSGEGVWSPNSQWILDLQTVTGETKGIVINMTLGKAYELPQRILNPVWTPDSQMVINQVPDEDGIAHLYGLNVDCFVQLQPCEFKELTFLRNQGNYIIPVWSPDWHSIAFTYSNDGALKIMVARLRCTDLNETCIDGYATIGDTLNLSSPIWSADSQELAFVADKDEIEIVEIKTQKKLSFPVNNDLLFLKSWSPDRRYIMYLTSQNNLSVYILDVLSGASRQLFPNFASYEYPSWRPMPH